MYLLSRTTIVAIGGSIVLSAAAQLCMKAGILSLPARGLEEIAALAWTMVLPYSGVVVWVGAGLLCYAFSMLLWLVALRNCALSIAYPFLSLSYIFVYAGAVWWPTLHEIASWPRTAGTLLIAAGVMLVAWTGADVTTEPRSGRALGTDRTAKSGRARRSD